MKLYHYVHCPFCIRVRMVLSFLKQDYESIILAYDDEETPLALMGVKMLPIIEFQGKKSNESLDIISMLDRADRLKTKACIANHSKLEKDLNLLGNDIHSLAMPYFIWTPEFNDDAREYFQKKKEKKRGAFSDLVKKRAEFEKSLLNTIDKTEHLYSKMITEDNIILDDILIASHLWGMYIVPEFQFPTKVHNYLQQIARVTNFSYHGLYWS